MLKLLNMAVIISIGVSITQIILATYLSSKHLKLPPKTILPLWILTFFICAGTVYLIASQYSEEKEFFDILSPNITAKESYAYATNNTEIDENTYDLIDVIGSYYICLSKPDVFFHRFPEWFFLFRSKETHEIIEVRVSDSRLPPRPKFEESIIYKADSTIATGGVSYFFQYKIPLNYIDAYDASRGNTNSELAFIDYQSREFESIEGSFESHDDIPEVVESSNAKVFARVRVACRPSDIASGYRVVASPVKLGSITITKSVLDPSPFLNSLHPITNWHIDVDKAIKCAKNKGALAIPPGKNGQTGGPGFFRLLNTSYPTSSDTLVGCFWSIPFRVGIIPILIDADNGKVYGIDSTGHYSTHFKE
jgi:hypothetical protein